MKNVILTDFKVPSDWSFLKILGGESWEGKYCPTNRLNGSSMKKALRQALMFLFPLSLVLRRKQFGKIIAWQQFYGLNFAFWCRLLHLKKVNDLTVMTFIYKKKLGGVGLFYHKYMAYIVTSQYIDRFICFSKEECSYYADTFGVDVDKFVYVPLGKGAPEMRDTGDDGYIFSTGRSNRDYDFLVSALKGTNYRCVIACDSYKAKCPANVSVLTSCHDDDMLRQMAHCHCVAIPLKDLRISAGQLVALQAMSMGKPVVCTSSDGIKDYVENGVTGLLVNNDKESWMAALQQLYAPDGCHAEMSKNAGDIYRRTFTEEAMYRRISNVVNGGMR